MADAVLDTNVILRHLLNDNTVHSPAASAVLARIEAGEITASLSSIAIAEAVWVLSGQVYRLDRTSIHAALTQLIQLPNLSVRDRDVLLEALDIYRDFNVAFADAFHAAIARQTGGAVYSFDRGLGRIPGITRLEPAPPRP